MASGSNAPDGQRLSDVPARPSLDGRASLGKYEIVRQLGAGGMGTVYLAVDSQLKRTIALKVLPKDRTENETLVRRFEAEAQASAQLKHENIVTVYDAGRIDGHLYIALEFVEGTDIYELVARRGPLPLKRSINFIKQIAHALEHLHKRGFVHRDIKPSNILVTREGQAKLTDMGLARAVDESLKSNITREGTTVGTVDYMAPEQARDSQSADIRSDIYSLGCTWYQMLTGEPPFPTGSVTNKLYAHISKPRPDPRALNRSIPEEIVALLHRMMARKPDDRYQTPTEVLEDIANLGSGNKRIEELLSSDLDDDSPDEAPTPSYGSPSLPPRHLPSRSAQPPRQVERPPSDPTPRPDRMPARRGRVPADPASTSQSETSQTPTSQISPPQTPPPQRLPARQVRGPSDSTPLPGRSPVREIPVAPRDNTPRSSLPTRRGSSISEQPVSAGRVRPRTAETPDEERVAKPKRITARESRAGNELVEDEGPANVDWKPFARKAAAVAGGLLALGACVWLGVSWQGSSGSRGDGNGAKSPFAAVSAQLPAESEKEYADKNADPPKTDGKTGRLPKKQGVLVDLKKAGGDVKSTDSLVLGRPEERQNFPAWIAELWNPNAPPSRGRGTPELKTITVGRVGTEWAVAPSLTAAIELLPEQGGIVELRGPGPFLLPAIKIANRGRLVITAAKATGFASNRTGSPANKDVGADNEQAPLIVIVPGPGAGADSGLLVTGTSLTLYGVHLAAFADQFPGDNPFRLIDVRSSDLIVQKCSLTLVGGRNGATIAFSVSTPSGGAAPERPTRILLDRTLVRGKDITAVEADLPSVDLLAINSLLVTGKAPFLSLTAGTGRGSEATDGKGTARNLRFFSCTTCTDEMAVSLRLGGGNPPTTKFHVMNSVFGTVFQPQGPAMISLNDWPSRPITATNRIAFENLTWMTESFVARGWQNLVQSDTSPTLGTKDAGSWAAYWGEPRSNIDFEPASFPLMTQIATADPAQFKSDGVTGRPGAVGETSPPGCDVGLLSVASPENIVRAGAFSTRPTVPASLTSLAAENSKVKEIDLDNPNRRDLENLAKFINKPDWTSGTHFVVRGTNKKNCGPIHVTNRSFSIEFVDPPPLLTFEDTKGESHDHSAFISVTGGTIEIINANFRVGSTAKRSPHWLLDVKDGSFAIRNSSIEGPSFEKPGYEGLIHFSTTRSIAPGKDAQLSCGVVQNSFLRTSKIALSGDLGSRNLIGENSILAAGGRVFDLHLPPVGSPISTLELTACTIAAGDDYFHFDAGPGSNAGSNATRRIRVIAEGTVFAPPVQTNAKADEKPLLIGGLAPESISGTVDWWEYACAYSNLIGLPNAASPTNRRNDPLADWKQLAGGAHIVRTVFGPNAVLLPRDLPTAKELSQGDFHLKSVAVAETWSDTGTPIGAILAARAVSPTKATPTPKVKSPSGRKPSPVNKTPSRPSSGI